MRTVLPAVAAAFASATAVIVTFVRIDFASGTVALNSSNWDFTWASVLYRGAAGLGGISNIPDQPGELQGLQLELHRVDSALIALALDDADQVQGALVTISTAIIDSATGQILDVELDWTGYGDKMGLSEDGDQASVVLTAENKGVDLLRGNPSTYSDADQQSLYPGDRAFEYVVSQSEQAVVWPAKSWFYR